MNISKHPILNSIYNACIANEEFPASEKQTAQAILLGDIGNQVEKLVDALTAAESRVAALERDGERLDWLEKHVADEQLRLDHGKLMGYSFLRVAHEVPMTRAAIDAAQQADAATGKTEGGK
jgi:hypothetical protein